MTCRRKKRIQLLDDTLISILHLATLIVDYRKKKTRFDHGRSAVSKFPTRYSATRKARIDRAGSSELLFFSWLVRNQSCRRPSVTPDPVIRSTLASPLPPPHWLTSLLLPLRILHPPAASFLPLPRRFN